MPAEVMANRHIDVFTSAADAITMDGYVVNKVGTLQIAILANYFDIPYFVTGIPDTVYSWEVTIEQRDPELVLEARGIRNTKETVKGYYPSFDITPPPSHLRRCHGSGDSDTSFDIGLHAYSF